MIKPYAVWYKSLLPMESEEEKYAFIGDAVRQMIVDTKPKSNKITILISDYPPELPIEVAIRWEQKDD